MSNAIDFGFTPYDWQKDFLSQFPPQPVFEPNEPHNGLVIAGRQQGKTEQMLAFATYAALSAQDPDSSVLYVAQSLKAARQVFWPRLKSFLRPIIKHCKISESLMNIKMPNGVYIRIFGGDKDGAESIRGISKACVLILDEFDNIPRSVYYDVILPTTAAIKHPKILFSGTLKGSRFPLWQLYEQHKHDPDWVITIVKASEAGVLSPERLQTFKDAMPEAAFQRELECDPHAAVEHAVIGKQMQRVLDEGRITDIPLNRELKINFAFDLGTRDATSIWVYALVDSEIWFLAYHEFNDMGLQDILEALLLKYGAFYICDVVLPHDVNVREMSTAKSRLQLFYDYHFGDPWPLKHGRIADGINCVRVQINRAWFDAERCDLGIQRLRNARYAYDERNDVLLDKIVHDENSHGLDAMRYAMVAIDYEHGAPTLNNRDFKPMLKPTVNRSF